MNRLLIMTFCFAIFGCSGPKKTVLSHKELAFKKFVSKQRIIDLPLNFHLNTYPMFVIEGSDTLFIPNDSAFVAQDTSFIPSDVVTGRAWGIYKDTSKCYILVSLGARGYPVPEIITYDKKGNRISKERLRIGECDIVNYQRTSDCSVVVFRQHQSSLVSFGVRDSVVDFNYGHPDKNIRGTKEHYVKFKNGSVDSSGHISVRTGSINLIN